jgi:hypothetical protein
MPESPRAPSLCLVCRRPIPPRARHYRRANGELHDKCDQRAKSEGGHPERRRHPSLAGVAAVTGWHPWISLERELRPLFAERIERGATDELDRKIMALIVERRRIQLAGWFS